MTIFTVGSAAELNAALSSATGGDRIELKAGNYGSVNLSGKAFASGVTIAAQNSGNPPVFDDMLMMNCKNIALDGVKFNFVPNANTMEWTPALEVRNSSGISVTHSTFTGGNAVAGSPTALSNYGVQGMAVGRGMVFMNSTNVDISNNTMTGFTHSIRFVNVDQVQVNNNDISGFRRAAVSGSDIDNLSIVGNHFHDPHPWNFGPKGDHGDFIHLWTTSSQPDANQNITIKDNFLDQGQGTGILGIFLNDGTGKAFQNVFILDNVIHTSNGQGMRLEGVHGGTIQSNTIMGLVQTPSGTPKIIFDHGNLNLLVDKNIYMGTGGNQMATAATNNIVFGQNLTVQLQSATKPNYAGSIFVDALNTSPTLASYLIKAGTAGIGLGAIINGTIATPSTLAGPGSSTGVPTTGGTGTDTGGTTVPVKTTATLATTAVQTTTTSKTTTTTDKMLAAKTTTDKMLATKITLAGDTLQIKHGRADEKVGIMGGDGGDHRVMPKVTADKIDLSALLKSVVPDPVKTTSDVKTAGPDKVAGVDLGAGERDQHLGDHQPTGDHHDLPEGAVDHFAFVDGHHPVGDFLQA